MAAQTEICRKARDETASMLVQTPGEDTNMRFSLVFCMTAALTLSSSAEAAIYVKSDAMGAANGSNWADAYPTLQAALGVGANQDIWLALGTYTPGPSGGPRTLSFLLPSGVRLFGGFAGTESALEQRDPQVNATILSGDLNRDDSPNTPGSSVENAYQVVRAVTLAAPALLDGVTVRAARSSSSVGGAIYVENSDP